MGNMENSEATEKRVKRKGPNPPPGKPPLTTEKGTVCANLLDAYIASIRENGSVDMVSFALQFGSCNFSSLTHRAEQEFEKNGEELCSNFDDRWIEVFSVRPINPPVEDGDLRKLKDELLSLASRIDSKLSSAK